jgi:hypothetical protein
MRFWIRLADLRTANYSSNTDCFLARAIKRKIPKAKVLVHPDFVEVGKTHYAIVGNGVDRLKEDHDTKEKGFHVRLRKVSGWLECNQAKAAIDHIRTFN